MTNLENNDQMTAGFTTLSPDGQEYISSKVEDIRGQDGNDSIFGFLTGDEPGSTLFGNGGDDYIRSRGIGDSVFGGRGNDTVFNDNGRATIYGDLDSDYLFAQDSKTTLFGGRLFGEPSADEGNDTLVSKGGENILDGGGGNDQLIGEDGNDTMAGRIGDDTIKGGPGGASYLFGNEGKDSIVSISNDEPDTLGGGRGDDTLKVLGAAEGPGLFGGVGGDYLSINVNVNNALIFGDVQFNGGFGGTGGENAKDYFDIQGGEGHTLAGNIGDDTFALSGSVGQTSIYGGQDNDYIFGGSTGAYADLEVFGDKGNDTISFAGSVSVSNSVFSGDNANITSDFGDNVIEVRGSGNTLYGVAKDATGSDAGDNLLRAIALDPENPGSTSNMLVGGVGNDTIDAGSSGAGDILDGGADGDDKYIFTKGQTIVPDTKGINTYIGVDAVSEAEITVRPVDKIGGEANFFIPGDQSNSVTELNAGGVRTEGGNDFILMDTVTGKVDTGDGNDRIEVGAVGSVGVAASVNGGAGDDIITVTGTDGVIAESTVSAGAGDDILNLTNVAEGAFVFGNSGENKINVTGVMAGELTGGIENDSIVINEVAKTGIVNTGDGNDTVEVDIARAGATFIASGEQNRIFVDSIGAALDESGSVVADGEAVISFTGGAGADRMGLKSTGEAVNGSVAVSLDLNGGGGNDLLQGGPFRDVINGGAGDDILYGGAPTLDSNKYNSFDLNNISGSNFAAGFVKVTDGETISGNAGADRFVIRSTDEVGGALQTALASTQNGTNGVTFNFGTDDAEISSELLAENNFLVGSNGQFVTDNNSGTNVGTGFYSGAVGIDTLNDFSVGQDTIFIDLEEFSLGGDVVGTIHVFTGQGALFGGIVDSGTNAGVTSTDGSNVFGANGFFKEQFAVAGTTDATDIDFDINRQLFFDTASKGLYLGNGDGAALIAVLPNSGITATSGTIANNFVRAQTIGGLGGDLGDLALF